MNFELARKAYIDARQKELETVARLDIPKFQTVRIDCATLGKDEAIDRILDQVRNKGMGDLKKKSNILYYFSIVIGGNNLLEDIKEFKSKNKEIALPRIGKEPKSSILYVGKTSNNFELRLRQHLDAEKSGTYALRLGAWATELGLVLDLHFAKVPLTEEDGDLLELVESIYHHGMKPLLGRSGH